ncbi:ANTAR domain-containing protein [Halopseudomonas sabulinigri]|uniref:ANTAR domain-containing protein n=1 Tax=Halopseudomonas sabulinigri TaxID=472181 RepID=A0A1H1NF09_9GAMM|nr:nitrate regulatory protein [Halopseudomonas sabulinigri]SDR97538.1 ANTAR domain-containing protein [Halopseudomonas sabulinigri]
MSTALDFMLAARRSEMQGLQALALTCQLVSEISRLVHALQRERGFSNMYLGGQAERYRQPLDELSATASACAERVRKAFNRMDIEHGCGADKARLFTRVAFVLHGLDALPAVRRRVRAQQISAQDATRSFTRLIAGLLAVVFEAADTAVDPRVTRALVAMFNFMQGKELAGQERAIGVSGFIAGYFDQTQRDKLAYLEDAQRRCFDTFIEFADPDSKRHWLTLCSEELVGEIARLRQVAARTNERSQVQAAMGELWFELTSQRIDSMKQVEDDLADKLQLMCEHSTSQAKADLDSQRRLLKRLNSLDDEANTPAARLYNVQATELDPLPGERLGNHVQRSVLEVLHEQTVRLQQLHDELENARRSLSERKTIERAKGVLMTQQGLSEEEAFRALQSAAMERSQKLCDVAQTILNYDALLKTPVTRPGPR